LAQEVPWPFEVIVIDSASTDGTWELVKSLAVKPICIQPNEFNHGQTRNLGAHQAKGRFLVFLVQDAVPVNDTWLERLVTAAEYPGVAGSYGRELPWPSDNLLVRLHTQQALAQNQERLYQRLAPESPMARILTGVPESFRQVIPLFMNPKPWFTILMTDRVGIR
jgi:glycosyltransferase involved in cell wall biosynthesis